MQVYDPWRYKAVVKFWAGNDFVEEHKRRSERGPKGIKRRSMNKKMRKDAAPDTKKICVVSTLGEEIPGLQDGQD